MRLGLLFLTLVIPYCSFAQSKPVLRAQASYYRSDSNTVLLLDSIIHVHQNGRNTTITPVSGSDIYPIEVNTDDTTTRYEMQFCSCIESRAYSKFNAAGLEVQKVTIDSKGALTSGTVHTYNASLLPEKSIIYNIIGPYQQTLYSYNNGLLVARREELWSNGSWTPSRLDSTIYSASGVDSVRLIFKWNKNTSSYREENRNKYVRDAANRIIIDSGYYDGSFGGIGIIQYDAQGRLAEQVISWVNSQNQIAPFYKFNFHYDAQSNLTSMMSSGWTGSPSNKFERSYLDSFSYNTHNQVTSAVVYWPLAGGGWRPAELRFRQFYYHDPLNVPEAATQNDLQLYPIPATTYINISMSFTKPQPFSVRIFDMQGRLVSNWQEAAQKDYNKQIPLTNMAPGQYTVHIFAGNESVSRQFTVVR